MSSSTDNSTPPSLEASYAIVGVVGHIDHGKTSLVAALTGVDTDTHPEEKRRGITIDLGFAHMIADGWQFAFIDAPGHQKYIGNLLAGVSKLDVGLLVVASDQGIQEQTLEHVAILRMLGVNRLIVALSRTDLAGASQQQELAEELELFLGEYGFHDFPVIPVSIKDTASVSRLRAQLVKTSQLGGGPGLDASDREDGASPVSRPPFRLPIDRIFTVEGRGCVVAGVVWSGSVAAGDQLEIPRLGIAVRVRDMESHDQPVDGVGAGRRAAMNLSGVSARELERGDELLTPGSFRVGRRFLAAIRLFPDASPVPCPAIAQLHTATTQCEARIVGARKLTPGSTCYGVVEVSQPLVVTHGQLALLRRPYPVGSFAGATLLCGLDERQPKLLLQRAAALASPDPVSRLAAWVAVHGEWDIDAREAWQQLGIAPDGLGKFASDLTAGAAEGEELPGFVRSGDKLLTSHALERSQRYLEKLLSEATASEDAWIIEPALVERASSTGSTTLVRMALQQLVDAKRAVRLNERVALASDETRLSKRQRARMADLLETLADNRMPPTLKELSGQLQEPLDMLTSLARFATQQGLLVEVSPGLLLSQAVFQRLVDELTQALENGSRMTASELKERLQLSRKYAIPFLEKCDEMRVTLRHGDHRSLGGGDSEVGKAST